MCYKYVTILNNIQTFVLGTSVNATSNAVSLSNQYGDLKLNSSAPSCHGNSSLPAVTTNSACFLIDDNKVTKAERLYVVEVNSRGKTWYVKRNVEDFRLLDQQCHQCVYDRKYSQLDEIPMEENLNPNQPVSIQYHGTPTKVRHNIIGKFKRLGSG